MTPFQTIAAIIDAAAPVDPPHLAPPARISAPKDETGGRRQADAPAGLPSQQGTGANVVTFPGATGGTAAPPAAPAAAATSTQKTQSSQVGGSEAADTQGAGGEGDDLDWKLAFYPQTDLGNTERFRERNRDRLAYCPELGWLWWDERRWCRDGGDLHVKRAEHETVRAIQSEAKAVLKAASTEKKKARREELTQLGEQLAKWGRKSETNGKIVPIAKNAENYLAVTASQLDGDPFAINVQNGTILVRREWPEGTDDPAWQRVGDYIRLKPHDPRDMITKLAPVVFDPAAGREQFDRFLGEVQPDPTMRRFLQQWKGYSLTGDASEHCMALFIGVGRNGKSVFEDTTAHVAGDYAETVPIETFLASGREANANAPTPARALLYGARMVRTSEPNKGASFDEGFLKLATGGEPIQARNLNLPMFRFYPILKLTVSGNHRPQIKGADEGIWSRVKLVLWEITIPPERRDRMLTQKLRAEASGILNWMLDGVSDWIENGLVYPEKVVEATADYRRDSDHLGRFLELCVVREPDARTQSSVLLAVFNAWARATGGTEWKGRGLSNAMTERGFKKDKSSVMFWLGIRLVKSEADFPSVGGRVASDHRPSGPRDGDGRDYGDEDTF